MSPSRFTGFTAAEYDVFDIPTFAERMAALRARVRPRLIQIGEELSERLLPVFGPGFYPHVASHLRRRVNPPPDTWVAFGPSRKGYKAHPHLSVGISGDGPYLEFIVMEESPHKALLAENLSRNAEALSGVLSALPWEAELHLDHHAPTAGLPARDADAPALAALPAELLRYKNREFMIAIPFGRDDAAVQGRRLLDFAADAFTRLEPFYRCALTPGIRLSQEAIPSPT